MSEETSELVAYIQSQIEEITTIHAQAEKALNAVQGKDHVTKWKRKNGNEKWLMASRPS
jgi:hypothetical protein